MMTLNPFLTMLGIFGAMVFVLWVLMMIDEDIKGKKQRRKK